MHNIRFLFRLCALLSFGSLLFTAPSYGQVSFNIQIGPPPPPHEVIVVAPFAGAVWVPGYYVFDYEVNQYRWHSGVWMRPPYAGAVWVAPRYAHRGRYYGYVAGSWATPSQVRARAARRTHGHVRGGAEGRPIRPGRAPMGGE